MTIISLQNASKEFGIKDLFKNLNLDISNKEKLGLIGPNGSGKSTLLKVLSGDEKINEGKIYCAKGIKISLLSQDDKLNPQETVLESVLSGLGEERELIRKFTELSELLVSTPKDNSLIKKFDEITNKMYTTNAWSIEQEIKEILQRLGIIDLNTSIEKLSGGYRKRVGLASALVSKPDLLLLDEPTNHLDAASIEWLQSWLKNYRGALVLVTHDRYVLDNVTEKIIELDKGESNLYMGNYEKYLKLKNEKLLTASNLERKLKNILNRELKWLKKGPKARAKKQKARINRIKNMQDINIDTKKKILDINSSTKRMGRLIVEAEDIQITDNGKKDGKVLIDNFTYSFQKRDRIGIIGPNGIGKTSFLNVLAGKRCPEKGLLKIGETIRFGYLDQNTVSLTEGKVLNIKVIDYVEEIASRVIINNKEFSASKLLENFLFPPSQQYSPLNKLSGGECRRLNICRMLINSPNFLILDEPTNDLDIETLRILEEFLEEFEGCVVIVSHDRYFLDRTVDKIFNFEEGVLKRYNGNYSGFLEIKEKKEEHSKQNILKETSALPRGKKFTGELVKKRSFKESAELLAIEQELPILEKQKKILEESISLASGDLTAQSNELANLMENISKKEERWIELSDMEH